MVKLLKIDEIKGKSGASYYVLHYTNRGEAGKRFIQPNQVEQMTGMLGGEVESIAGLDLILRTGGGTKRTPMYKHHRDDLLLDKLGQLIHNSEDLSDDA